MTEKLTPLSYSIIELEIALMNIFKGMIDLIQVVNSTGDLAIELNDVITDKEQFYKLFKKMGVNHILSRFLNLTWFPKDKIFFHFSKTFRLK
jgi:hypothetical protein